MQNDEMFFSKKNIQKEYTQISAIFSLLESEMRQVRRWHHVYLFLTKQSQKLSFMWKGILPCQTLSIKTSLQSR